jgi:Icc-related predicted phosphoesterase
MKILAAADIHGSQYRLNLILSNVSKYSPDLVIICGDITQFGPGEVATQFLNQIPVETLALPGNIDPSEVNGAIDESRATNVNMKIVKKDSLTFAGVSGVDERQTKEFAENYGKLIDKDTILITHVPPHGLQDRVFLGMHSGSKELRKLLENHHPKLVLCGHIHEDPGFTKINNTVVVNCSLGKRGEGALVTFEKDNLDVQMIE